MTEVNLDRKADPQAHAVFTAAMDRLRDEIAKENGQTNAAAVGEIMSGLLQLKPELAEKILADGKSVAGAVDAMKTEVKKRTRGRDGGLHIFEGMRIVLDYYGIEGVDNAAILNASAMMFAGGDAAAQVHAVTASVRDVQAGPPAGADELDLDALLAETRGDA